MSRLTQTGIGLMAAGTVGIIIAIAMEIATQEPIYFTVMKITAGLFGVGGPLFGWGIARRSSKRRRKKD